MKTRLTPMSIWIAVFFLSALPMVEADVSANVVDFLNKSGKTSRFNPIFPYALTQAGAIALAGYSGQDTVPTKEEMIEKERGASILQSVLLNNDIFSLYGKPGANGMGILGQYKLSDIEPVMNQFIQMYDDANGSRGIIPSMYMIFGTCWPEGEIGILSDATIRTYIEFARQRGWYVFLDHQIGRYSVEDAMKKLLPYLKYENVHLALDPEWRTTKPMQEIGSVTAAELNIAQTMMENYMIENNLPGRRILVVHQFKPKMISDRPSVRSDFELVQLIQCADGFGSPSLKKNTYALNAEAKNIPLKSFKLFLKPTIEKAGYDIPLMTPQEVFLLEPRPYLIMYQ